MFIVVGLGNPGKAYEGTRHNVGFHTISYLEEKLGFQAKKLKFQSLTEIIHYEGEKILFMKPQTYMNRSGIAVAEAMRFYDVPIENLIVIYDDLDIPFGKVRIRPSGSAGSHNGMKSVLQHIQDDQFPRVRIGIGEERKGETADFVLSRFQKSQEKEINDCLARAGDATLAMISRGVDFAMNQYNPL